MSEDNYILPKDKQYCLPGLNEIRFISHRQTMSLVLGSCVSTVFVGKKSDEYYLGANHIVIAEPKKTSVVATKSARQQIEVIYRVFEEQLHIPKDDYFCLHVMGGGQRGSANPFRINENNISGTMALLDEKGMVPVFVDVGSHYYANYSLCNNNISIFVENKFTNMHLAFIMDLEMLFKKYLLNCSLNPESAVLPGNDNFECMTKNGIITLVTGERKRLSSRNIL